MALVCLRPAHRCRSELHRQPVDQSRQLACPAGLLDQAVLRGVQFLCPLRLEGESVEAELRIERGRLVGEQA